MSGSAVYVTGFIDNTSFDDNGVRFGGRVLRGASASNTPDVFVVKYTDAGSSATFAWAQAGGGTAGDAGYGIAVSGSAVYVTGYISQTATFGSTTLSPGRQTAFGARLGANGPLATRAGEAASFAVYPNPARSGVTVTGVNAGEAVQVLDGLGRRVAGGPSPGRGPWRLEFALLPGLYVIRAGPQAHRLVVE